MYTFFFPIPFAWMNQRYPFAFELNAVHRQCHYIDHRKWHKLNTKFIKMYFVTWCLLIWFISFSNVHLICLECTVCSLCVVLVFKWFRFNVIILNFQEEVFFRKKFFVFVFFVYFFFFFCLFWQEKRYAGRVFWVFIPIGVCYFFVLSFQN